MTIEARHCGGRIDAKIARTQCHAEPVLVQAGGLDASIVSAKGNRSVLAMTRPVLTVAVAPEGGGPDHPNM